MTEKRKTCMRLLLYLLNRIYETRFCNDKLLDWTRKVGGIFFATKRYDIVTNQIYTVATDYMVDMYVFTLSLLCYNT